MKPYTRMTLLGVVMTGIIVAGIASKEYAIATGTKVVLAVHPVDPRSLWQGDYVALRYLIEEVETIQPPPEIGATAWVELKPGSNGIWSASGLHRRRPANAVAIRGSVVGRGECAPEGCHRVILDYGIRSFFVPEGAGIALENAVARDPESVRVAAAIPSSGRAVLLSVTAAGETRPIE